MLLIKLKCIGHSCSSSLRNTLGFYNVGMLDSHSELRSSLALGLSSGFSFSIELRSFKKLDFSRPVSSGFFMKPSIETPGKVICDRRLPTTSQKGGITLEMMVNLPFSS